MSTTPESAVYGVRITEHRLATLDCVFTVLAGSQDAARAEARSRADFTWGRIEGQGGVKLGPVMDKKPAASDDAMEAAWSRLPAGALLLEPKALAFKFARLLLGGS